mgnify:CR=1 FL=1
MSDSTNITTNDFICEHCNKHFVTKGILGTHQKTAKYCLSKQGIVATSAQFACEYCNKIFTLKQTCTEHSIRCKVKKNMIYVKEIDDMKQHYEQIIDNQQQTIVRLEKTVVDLHGLLQLSIKSGNTTNIPNIPPTISQQMDGIIEDMKETAMAIKDKRIKQLENVCLSKKSRVIYPERNVIYILTTDDHLLRRTYIVGKAKNLTARLGTYNKTCDHTVVHYRECKNEEEMDMVEATVLYKLREYREQANRDRFILPEDKEISFFTDIVDECVKFV